MKLTFHVRFCREAGVGNGSRPPTSYRKRQAMDAAQRHDVAALWRLTENWLLTHGGKRAEGLGLGR